MGRVGGGGAVAVALKVQLPRQVLPLEAAGLGRRVPGRPDPPPSGDVPRRLPAPGPGPAPHRKLCSPSLPLTATRCSERLVGPRFAAPGRKRVAMDRPPRRASVPEPLAWSGLGPWRPRGAAAAVRQGIGEPPGLSGRFLHSPEFLSGSVQEMTEHGR